MDYVAIEPLLRLALDGYRQGREKASRVSAAASGLGFDRHLAAQISARLSVDEQLLLRVSSGARARALTSARANHMALARQALDESSCILCSADLSDEARLIVSAFHEAAAAYFDYKRGRYDDARQRVFKALEADNTLIAVYRFTILELHRVQLGHNLMRILARESPVDAARFCAHLLRYIDGDNASWPVPHLRSVEQPGDLPCDLLEAMYIQISGEMAVLLAGKQVNDATRIFKPLLRLLELDAVIGGRLHARAKAWLRLKSSYVRRDMPGYLQQVASFLPDGPEQMTLLWRAAAADLYALCASLGAGVAAELKDEIGSDAKTWQPLPEQIRAVFATGSVAANLANVV